MKVTIELESCDLCGWTVQEHSLVGLDTCLVCQRDYCPSCAKRRPGVGGLTEVCKGCFALKEVQLILNHFDELIGPIVEAQKAALAQVFVRKKEKSNETHSSMDR